MLAKIYFCHPRNFEYKQRLYELVRSSVLNTQYEIVFPRGDDFSSFKTKEIIKTCDMVFADVSLPAMGLGIELGWADAYSVPVICVSKEGASVSDSLRFITNNFIEYSSVNDLVRKVVKFVARHKLKCK